MPQVPQGPAADISAAISAARPASLPPVANTDSFLSSDAEWQRGHSGVSEARTSFSKSSPQSWQTYSWIGMVKFRFERVGPDYPDSMPSAPRGPPARRVLEE
jgi:hypothetical protein